MYIVYKGLRLTFYESKWHIIKTSWSICEFLPDTEGLNGVGCIKLVAYFIHTRIVNKND
jgi:hypothetical protein